MIKLYLDISTLLFLKEEISVNNLIKNLEEKNQAFFKSKLRRQLLITRDLKVKMKENGLMIFLPHNHHPRMTKI